jgi:hypothetical protein
MEDVKFVIKNKKSISFIIVSTLVTVFAILWFQTFLFGGIAVGFGLLIIGYTDGFEINFKNRKYRNTQFIGPVAFGTWNDLPEISYISVFRTVIASSVRGLSNTKISSKEKVVIINLIYGKNKRLRVYKTEDIEDAFKKAQLLSRELDLRIYDATSHVGVWFEDSPNNKNRGD